MTRARRGTTLPAVFVLLTVMVLMIGYSTLLVNGATAVPRARRQVLQTDAATVTALGYLLDEWPVAWRTLANGGTATRTYTINGTTVNATVTRVTADEYRAAIGTAGGNAAETRTVTLARRTLSFPWNEVVATVGNVAAQSTAVIYGTDDPTCSPVGPAASGFRMLSTALLSPNDITYNNPGSSAERVNDATLTAAKLSLLGDFSLTDLDRLVTMSYSTTTTLTAADLNRSAGPDVSGQCISGWGSPGLVTGCEGFFPIVRTTGALTLNGGQGQGIILVDGSLVISGGTVFYGVIINRGATGVTITGSPTTFKGRIINTNPAATITIGAGATIWGSSCAIARLQNSRALARPIARASLFDAIGSGGVR